MENYVRCELITKKKNPKNILCKNKVADKQEQIPKRERVASFSQEGTGRYAQTEKSLLQSCIANEKGLLVKEDFEHVQKVIEVYSKALLCEIRKNHLIER